MEIAFVAAGLAIVGGLIQIGVSHVLILRREREAALRLAQIQREEAEKRAAAEREAEERRVEMERQARYGPAIHIASFPDVQRYGPPTSERHAPPQSTESEMRDMPEPGFRRPVGAYLVVIGLVALLGLGAYYLLKSLA